MSLREYYAGLQGEITEEDDTTTLSGGGVYGQLTDVTDDSMYLRARKAARATPETNEYTDAQLEYFKKTVSTQYANWIEGKTANACTAQDYPYGTAIKSYFTFTFDTSIIGMQNGSTLIMMMLQTYASDPNLCAFMTQGYLDYSTPGKLKLSVGNLYSMADQKMQIYLYKRFLSKLEYAPKMSTRMTDEEILLYLHDAMVHAVSYNNCAVQDPDNLLFAYCACGAITEFRSTKQTVPYQIVCQAIAMVMNHMMQDLGFTCEYITSTVHAWNAVKLSGKWYYIDVTWDLDTDTGCNTFCKHDYLLCNANDMDQKDGANRKAHYLDTYSAGRVGNIEANMGSSYTNWYPKTQKKAFAWLENRGEWIAPYGAGGYSWGFWKNGTDSVEPINDERISNDAYSNVFAIPAANGVTYDSSTIVSAFFLSYAKNIVYLYTIDGQIVEHTVSAGIPWQGYVFPMNRRYRSDTQKYGFSNKIRAYTKMTSTGQHWVIPLLYAKSGDPILATDLYDTLNPDRIHVDPPPKASTSPTPAPTATPKATATPVATRTPAPTVTPIPAATEAPENETDPNQNKDPENSNIQDNNGVFSNTTVNISDSKYWIAPVIKGIKRNKKSLTFDITYKAMVNRYISNDEYEIQMSAVKSFKKMLYKNKNRLSISGNKYKYSAVKAVNPKKIKRGRKYYVRIRRKITLPNKVSAASSWTVSRIKVK